MPASDGDDYKRVCADAIRICLATQDRWLITRSFDGPFISPFFLDVTKIGLLDFKSS